jgi:hypothetical protein
MLTSNSTINRRDQPLWWTNRRDQPLWWTNDDSETTHPKPVYWLLCLLQTPWITVSVRQPPKWGPWSTSSLDAGRGRLKGPTITYFQGARPVVILDRWLVYGMGVSGIRVGDRPLQDSQMRNSKHFHQSTMIEHSSQSSPTHQSSRTSAASEQSIDASKQSPSPCPLNLAVLVTAPSLSS